MAAAAAAGSGAVSTAPVQFAQRSDSVYVTIAVADVDAKTAKIELTDDKLTFTGTAHGKAYHTELEFYEAVDVAHEVPGVGVCAGGGGGRGTTEEGLLARQM